MIDDKNMLQLALAYAEEKCTFEKACVYFVNNLIETKLIRHIKDFEDGSIKILAITVVERHSSIENIESKSKLCATKDK